MNTHSPHKTNLEDSKIDVKIKLATLWASVTLCYLYGDYFELYVPGKVKGLIDGHNLLNDPQKLFGASLLLAIPAVMVGLSVILNTKLNRLFNLIFGTLFTLIMLLIAITSLDSWRMFYVFLALTESTITILIVLYAWKWPKQKLS
ncbi:hypothetical protein HZP56_02370 [Elizabethkingia anophelis]|uniref:Uncharacterized protein n=1 Tax=Elizabethkingia anophelis TaxID=1117645 RepID=A0AAE4P3A6_9FLAO|nr:hypothetical protein [Elizabethkingia anophelis]MCT3833317.1 hypothetical protein [Elizabethkingia anophelis]MCT3921178.1 hypothetical protein [Elizabethkingia anophelis]MCT3953487.1 hypothetical protein [Elizabethkingia anophelis]MCT3957076.1 hypothetical protein [Elizabethkingia anophelis]